MNNTNGTPCVHDDQSNNNRGAEQETDVVVALVKLGMGKRVAKGLARQYGAKRIAEKIAYLAFLQEAKPDKIASPRGWLRKAIEEDYGPPDGYRSAAEREAEAKREQEQQAQLALELEGAARRQQQEEAEEARRQRELYKQYGTTEREQESWRQFLDRLQGSYPGLVAMLQGSYLLRARDGKALIGGLKEIVCRMLSEHPGNNRVIRETLASVLGQPVALDFAVLTPIRADI
jgi:hypothetical protein